MAGVAATPEVAPDRDPIVFEGYERGVFGRGKLASLEIISSEFDSERSLVGLEARAF